MNNVDGQEVLFPVVLPRELLEESGRYLSIGSELVRLKDRNEKGLVLAMTHEEAAVQLCKNSVSSYKQLPFMIYQIQTKFRDEARPRGGLIRVREFTMKDGYSFHNTQHDLEAYYERVYAAYERIFSRIGLKDFVSVKSDTGMMGGDIAHEFMSLTEVGEDEIVLCAKCGYRSNMEIAPAKHNYKNDKSGAPLKEIFTGELKEIGQICQGLKIKEEQTCKAVIFAVKGGDETVIAFARGDCEISEAKLKKVVKKDIVPWTGQDESIAAGNVGPVNLNVKKCTVVFDNSLTGASGLVCGANKSGYHLSGLDIERDVKVKEFFDIAKAKQGQQCSCGGTLKVERAIEIGNIFQLGVKYTKSMEMTVLDDNGKLQYPIMGCYGIGVGRALASVAQQSRDSKGLIWPAPIAPWKVHICALRTDDKVVSKKAHDLHDKLEKAGIPTLFDDRDASAGVKFADADLMGMPIRVVVSPKSLAADEIEISLRANGESKKTACKNAVKEIKATLKKLV
ncbi:mitochondrial ribosome protein l39/prolyl-trna ligase family member [Holotrichia oblita]|nr:mitochondrial ribosome protein l39/prolyl-trna ligase family member [Holotrichia oblita]